MSYSRLEEMLCQIEQKNGVAQRWQTSEESFKRARNEANDKQKKALLCKVKTRVVERWFLLGLKAKYLGKYHFSSSCVTVSKIMLILTLTTSQHQILNRLISRYQNQDVHYYTYTKEVQCV